MPVSISLTDRPVLVVGGGAVALRKIETILEYGAKVTVVAPEADDKIKYFGESGRITLHLRNYQSPEAVEYHMIISASDDMEVNRKVSDDARGAGRLVNAVDAPALCDLIFPAVVRRDCLTTAISTDGQVPFMAGHVRKILDDIFPSHWKKLMQQATKFRKLVIERWPDDNHMKMVCYTQFLEADWANLLKQKDKSLIEAEIEKMLKPRGEKEDDGPPTVEFG
jgi:siroheme synthase-like protein